MGGADVFQVALSRCEDACGGFWGGLGYESVCQAGNYGGEFRYRGRGDGREAEPGSLEFFLLERYYLYAFDRGRQGLLRGQVAHSPYRFFDADLDRFDVGPMSGHGIVPVDPSAIHVCAAEDVRVRILGLERLDR